MNNIRIKNKVVKCLICEYNKSNTNIVKIGLDNVKNINLSEHQVAKTLKLLESSQLIKITRSSNDNTFTNWWSIEILLPCVEYFRNNRIEISKFIIPVIISILGSVAAILTAYFTSLTI